MRLRIRPLIASGLWARKGLDFTPAFMDIARLYYKAPAETLEFATEADTARTRINRWVAENTDDRIRELLTADGLSLQTAVVQTNAIHFEANWRSRFDTRRTKDETFFAAGQHQQVRLMQKRSSFRYGKRRASKSSTFFLKGGLR